MRCPRPVPGRNGDPSCQRLSGHSLSPSLLIVIRGLAGQRTADPRGFFRLVDWPELRRFDLGQLERDANLCSGAVSGVGPRRQEKHQAPLHDQKILLISPHKSRLTRPPNAEGKSVYRQDWLCVLAEPQSILRARAFVS
jgi:hypothetical protein